MTREEAAKAFAEKMGWRLSEHPKGRFYFVTNPKELGFAATFPLPAPDAPLHEHLAFVGRVAEAINARVFQVRKRDGDRGGAVAFRAPASLHWHEAPDISHAALLAALAALESR